MAIEHLPLENGQYAEFLSKVNVERMHDAQQSFWRMPLHELSTSDIEEILHDSLGSESGEQIVLPNKVETIPAGTTIFRGRLVTSESSEEQQLTFCSTATEFSAAPPDICTEGRLNADQESLFYGSFRTYPIINEISANPGDRIVIGAFKTLTKLKFVSLSPNYSFLDLGSELRLASKLQLSFIERLITIPLGKSSAHAYRTARYLAQNYFSTNNLNSVGWIFPSAFDFSQMNVALPRQNASKYLTLTHSGLFDVDITGPRLRSAVPRAIFRHDSPEGIGDQILSEDEAMRELLRVFGGKLNPITPAIKEPGK